MVAAEQSPPPLPPPPVVLQLPIQKRLSDWQAAVVGPQRGRCSIRTVLIFFLLFWLSYFQFQGNLCFNNGNTNGNGKFMAGGDNTGSFETNADDAITAVSLRAFYYKDDDDNVDSNINHTSSSSSSSPNSIMMVHKYRAAPVEDYVMIHAQEMGFESTANPTGCTIWTDPSFIHYASLQQYLNELQNYTEWVETFPPIAEDLRDLIRLQQQEQQQSAGAALSAGGNTFGDAKRQVCARLLFNNNNANKTNDDPRHPAGAEGWFAQSRQLSHTRHGGYVEPLLPPMRHANFCLDRKYLMSMEYMVHDFHHLCRQLTPTSRTIFLDMGASLDFHGRLNSPAMYATKIFRKFGFVMDHIYAFEITQKPPDDVFAKVPIDWMPAYHWINVPVTPELHHARNPLSSIIATFRPDDFIIVKLDVDTPSVELPLAYQLLNDHAHLVDVMFFEHHVHLRELASSWGRSMNGTIADSLRLFRSLREKGVAAHFWP
jgi:hypothetical protein